MFLISGCVKEMACRSQQAPHPRTSCPFRSPYEKWEGPANNRSDLLSGAWPGPRHALQDRFSGRRRASPARSTAPTGQSFLAPEANNLPGRNFAGNRFWGSDRNPSARAPAVRMRGTTWGGASPATLLAKPANTSDNRPEMSRPRLRRGVAGGVVGFRWDHELPPLRIRILRHHTKKE